jgi:hypothetical protein
MNERIKELHDKAFDGIDILEPNWFLKHNKKFAELIVLECATLCDETKDDYFKLRKATYDFNEKTIYAEGEAASDIIKYKMWKRFGVK